MLEKRKKSIEYFHVAPENLNCAQSILKGFQKEFDISEEEIAAYKAYGGGRAEDGICGALFAAKRLIGQKEQQNIENEFQREIEFIYCKELKKNKKACAECVALADRLVEERLKKQEP